MRAVIQRVTRGSVSIEGTTVGDIGAGLVILLGIRTGDGDAEAVWLAHKIANLRIFADQEGKFNRSLIELGGEALVVSQFTLYGNARKGRRPSFTSAARPEVAEPLVDRFVQHLREAGVRRVACGEFQAMMLVEIHNDGPVTIILDTDVTRRGNSRQGAPG
jgi:D-tyrosyl-tRNA(Tyr) deacylase